MNRRSQIQIATGILLASASYVAFYFHYRASGQITHFASAQGQHDVRATDDPWSALARDMASSNKVLHSIVVTQTPSAKLLNTLFWPLRRVEAAVHNKERGQQGGGEERR